MAEDALTFMELLQSFRRGELLDQADQRLVEVIDAIRDTGGCGTLTITLPFKMNKAGQIECTPDLKAKVPRRAQAGGLKLGFEWHRVEYQRRAYFNQIATAASEATGLTAVFGRTA